MDGWTGLAARRRPPELSSNGIGVSGSASSTSMATPSAPPRQRREGNVSSSSYQSPDRMKAPPRLGSYKGKKRLQQPEPTFLAKVQHKMRISAFSANHSLEKQLRRHGRFISRHPIRTLLLACLIITSLFYPAAGIYLWASKGGPGVTRGDARSVWRSLSTPLLDSFASSGRKHHNSLRDLRMVWDDAPDLRAVDARDADAYLGSVTPLNLFPHAWPTEQNNATECRSVRVEHVFVTTDDVLRGMGSRHGALDTPILQSALRLQETIEAHIREGGLRCVQALHSRECLLLSPLEFWGQDPQQLADDISPTGTLLRSKLNVSSQGIPLSLTTTLAGRGHLFTKLPRADHLALTFFLEDEEECGGHIRSKSTDAMSKSHELWLAMLRNITRGQVGILKSEITGTKEVVLQFAPRPSDSSLWTQRLLLAGGYLTVFIWLLRSLMKIQNVHSRFGLAFTAVVELFISMVVSVSVCALCGVRLTLVPWEILPFVVVVIGSESMFVLTNAIITTPISLTVPSRVAAGLEKVGVAIAVTVMSDVVLMTIIMMLVDVRAVREFCIFAVFALIVDFFLQMTLFSTVLSIDLQRLELADLLSQGGTQESNIPDTESVGSDPSAVVDGTEERPPTKSASNTSKGSSLIKLSCRTVWRARTARTASLSLLLAFMFGIYLYHGSGYPAQQTYPFQNTTQSIYIAQPSTTLQSETPGFDPFSHLSETSTMPLPWWHASPSAALWQALNPVDAASVWMKVEPWTVLSLRSTKTFEGRQRNIAHFASWAIFRPRVRAFIWFFKLVVLPISGTTGLLWVLLLYLLKDTELLEAQQSKSDALNGDDDDEEIMPEQEDGKWELDTSLRLSCTNHTSDIVLVRQAGKKVVSLAADSSLSLWMPSKRSKSSSILISSVLRDYTRVSAMQVDTRQDLIVLGHASGKVSFWTLSSLQLIEASGNPQRDGEIEGAARPSTQVQSIVVKSSAGERYAVYSAHRDGSIWRWTRGGSATNFIAARSDALWLSFTPTSSKGFCSDIVALSSSDRRFQLYQVTETTVTCLLATNEASSIVRCAALSTLTMGEEEEGGRASTWATAVVGTSRGSTMVFDLLTGQSLGQYDILDGPVTSIRAVDLASACPGHVGHRDFVLASSASQVTVLTISKLEIELPVTTINKQHLTSPSKKRNGVPNSLYSSGTSPPRINEASSTIVALSPKTPSSEEPGRFDAASAAVPINGVKQRRSLSNTDAPSINTVHSPGVSDMSPASPSTVNSTQSSILDHFDGDPFESAGQIQWARLASLECVRGGADLVAVADGFKLIGVRRRTKSGTSPSPDARWEAFELLLTALLPSTRSLESVEKHCVKRSRLELEDMLLLEQQQQSAATTSLPPRSIGALRVSRAIMPLLSFTRLDHVQAFDKDGPNRKKSAVIFAFANCVAAITSYPLS